MLKKLSHENQGFTLIELMVVIIILGVLAMWVAPKIMDRPGEARQMKVRLDIQNLETALKSRLFFCDHDRWIQHWFGG